MHSVHCITGQMSFLESDEDEDAGAICPAPGLRLCPHLKTTFACLSLEMLSYYVGIVPVGVLDLG